MPSTEYSALARRRPSKLWTLPPLIVLGLVFLYPLALIIGQAFHPGDADQGLLFGNFNRILKSALFQNALLHTLEISVASSLGCLLQGTLLALCISFVPFRGSILLARLIDTYIALPTFLLTLAFTFIYGSAGILNGVLINVLNLSEPPVNFLYSQAGVILAEITAFTPFVLRPLLATFSQFEISQIEIASSLGAKPWQIVRSIILPAALPALLAGGSLCLLLTVNEFGIVLFIGAKGVITLPLLVYGKAIQEGDYVAACTIATVNILISLALYSLYNSVVGRLGNDHVDMV
jgi:2-aminoethylphosphonate transport system permease protein